MGERINVGATSYAVGSAISAGVGAAVASIRYDRAIASQRQILAVIDHALLQDARSRVALANLRIRMGV